MPARSTLQGGPGLLDHPGLKLALNGDDLVMASHHARMLVRVNAFKTVSGDGFDFRKSLP